MGPRFGLDGYGNSRPLLGFDPRTVQPVASRYTDCASGLVAPKLLTAFHREHFWASVTSFKINITRMFYDTWLLVGRHLKG
jgi:hypothetical protein